MNDEWRLPLAVCVLPALLFAGCGQKPRAALPPQNPSPGPTVAQANHPSPPVDPVQAIIARAEKHFTEGQRQLSLGHLTEARTEFDRAMNVLLDSPQGARLDARLRDTFDRLVDQISGLEASALLAGDGFTEQSYEPASIDELLATSAFDGPSPATTPELTRTVEDDLATTLHDIPIPPNGRVLAYVQLFAGKLRDWMQASLQRGTRYLPMIQNVFRAEGLPLDLAYVPLIESAFKPNALSRAQAKGVWQFMKDTARENGLRSDWYIDERADPEKATLAAAKYLRTLHKMFGDWHLALASYNGGPGRVQRALANAGADDFWAISESPGFLPRETREYVPMILAAIVVAKNPAQYGLEISPLEPVAYDKVKVPGATDLRRVAEWIGTPVDELQMLNPELRRLTTPVQSRHYEIKVPSGTASVVERRVATAPPSELSALQWHTVKRGDTLASLARKFKVSRSELAEANNLSTKSSLKRGQELVIPRTAAPLVSTRNLRNAEAPVARASARTSGRTASNGTTVTSYTVRRGDTLYSIARRFGVSVNWLKSLNGLRANSLLPGVKLRVADPGAAATR